jgi:hypothetical protein
MVQPSWCCLAIGLHPGTPAVLLVDVLSGQNEGTLTTGRSCVKLNWLRQPASESFAAAACQRRNSAGRIRQQPATIRHCGELARGG